MFHTAFYTALLTLAVLVGCEFVKEAGQRAVSQTPGGSVPAEEIGENVPRVVTNPVDVDAWIEIAKAVGYILLGRYGPEAAKGSAGLAKNLIRRKV